MSRNCSVLVSSRGNSYFSSSSTSSSSVIKAGTLLLSCKPFAFTLNTSLASSHCDYCFKSNWDTCSDEQNSERKCSGDNKSELFQCSGCRMIRYCDKTCQTAGWSSGHKYECKCIRVQEKIPPPFVRLVLRVIVKLQTKEDIYDKISDKHHRRFRDLMSHYKDVQQDSVRTEHIHSVGKVLETILRHQKALTMPNESELTAICGRIYVNTFRINNTELTSLGTGLYLGASIFDHSCEPMGVATFESTNVFVRNIVDLPPNFPIENVTISYQDTIRPTKLRIQELKSIYYFECQCVRCSLKKYDLTMNAIKCPSLNCLNEVNLEMEKCPKCGEMFQASFISHIEEIEEIVKSKLDEMHTTAYLDICETSLKLMSKANFSETHWLNVSMASAAFDASIDFQLWEKAFDYGKLAIRGYRKYLSANHPFLGIVLLKMAKLSWFLEKEADAMEYAAEAKRILDITHEQSSSIHLNELTPLLQEIKQSSSQALNV